MCYTLLRLKVGMICLPIYIHIAGVDSGTDDFLLDAFKPSTRLVSRNFGVLDDFSFG